MGKKEIKKTQEEEKVEGEKKEEKGKNVKEAKNMEKGKMGRKDSKDKDSDEVSIAAGSSDEEPDADDYTSWDDTICSNRSAYFKMYYSQRGASVSSRTEEKVEKPKNFLPSTHNSLSSLIREKMGNAQGADQQKKKADMGLMVLVAALFIIIVVGIALTFYFYSLHVLELSIFNRIRFYEIDRRLEIYDSDWNPVLTAHLGSHLPPGSIPEDCTHYLAYLARHNYTQPHQELHDEEYEDIICLDWTSLAQLQLKKLPADGPVQCYSVWWEALVEDFALRDCLQVDPGPEGHGAWWGGGEMTDGGYPLTAADVPPGIMVTGHLGRDSWGMLLRRTWLSSNSSLLSLPDTFSGLVSVNHGSDGKLCLESQSDPPMLGQYSTMKYTLCTAPDLTILHDFLHQHAVNKRSIVAQEAESLVQHEVEAPRPLKPKARVTHDTPNILKNTTGQLRELFSTNVTERVLERLEHPVWVPWMPPDNPQLTQEGVLQYVDNILSQQYGLWGHILLPPSWQSLPGELEFDHERFPDPKELALTLEKKGFRLALTVHPFVSVEATAFNKGTSEGLWVRQQDSTLPALADYDEKHPSVVTDFSNPRSKTWYASRLEHLQEAYSIDRFHLQPADAHALPAYHEYHVPLPGPDSLTVHFMAAVSRVSPPVSTEGTITPPLPPSFLTLGTSDGAWAGLESMVPRLLTLSMLGYPLIDGGPIGGLARAGHVPERELYIRWLEVATFLPAHQVSVLPHLYDEEVVELAREYAQLRRKLVLPKLKARVEEALTLGRPVVSPLALFAPHDSVAASVADQWMIGPDVLVAPITRRSQRERDIYLPDGIWKDGIDGHLRRGGRWVTNYKVPLTKIPYFTLKPIDEAGP